MKTIKTVNLMVVMLLILLSSLTTAGYSDTYTTVSDGDWDDQSTWDKVIVPAANGDIIHIYHDVVLSQDVNFAFNSLVIHSGGSLKGNHDLYIRAGSRLQVEDSLRVYDLTFANTSEVHVSTSGNIQVTGNLVNNNNSDNVSVNGSITVDGDFDNGNGGEIIGDGYITAGTFSGRGSTFGITPNSSVGDGTTIPSLLPVELVKFTAECRTDNKIELSWTTASETNNDYFILEQSTNTQDWEPISTLSGAGNSQHEIVYTDYEESGKGTQYYRLAQVDFDGSIETFNIVSADCSLNQKSMDVYIYPNPFARELNIMLEDWPEGDVLFKLIDMNGKMVDQWKTSYGSLAIHKRINSSHIEPGMYVLNIITDDATKQFKVKKQ